MKQDISCVFEGVAGVGGIFISNLKAAQNLDLLNSNCWVRVEFGIKAIVTVVRNGIVQHDKSDITDHLYVPADDHEAYDLARHFQQTYNFIDNVRKKTNVLVHCHAGISRSATIVIAYLLRKYNYSLEKVISMVKRRRNKINPNKGFIQQLKKQALKKGIQQTFNLDQTEKVFDKFHQSTQKKRSLSSYNTYRYKTKNQSQVFKLGNSQQIDAEVKMDQGEPEGVLNGEVFGMGESVTQGKVGRERDRERVREREKEREQAYLEKQYRKIKQNLSLRKSKRTNSVFTYEPIYRISQIEERIKQNSTFQQKLQKIQKFKSKVLESQKRKKSKQKGPNPLAFAPTCHPSHPKPPNQTKQKDLHINMLITTKLKNGQLFHEDIMKKIQNYNSGEVKSGNKITLQGNSVIS